MKEHVSEIPLLPWRFFFSFFNILTVSCVKGSRGNENISYLEDRNLFISYHCLNECSADRPDCLLLPPSSSNCWWNDTWLYDFPPNDGVVPSLHDLVPTAGVATSPISSHFTTFGLRIAIGDWYVPRPCCSVWLGWGRAAHLGWR